MNKLIKLSETHYVIVDDSEIKEGDWIYHTSHGKSQIKSCEVIIGKSIVIDNGESSCWIDYSKKITHSTKPELLGTGWMQSVLPLLLSEVEKVINGYSVEKMAQSAFTHPDFGKYKVGSIAYYNGFKEGFNEHQELVKDKLFTIEDMQKAFDFYAFSHPSHQPYNKSELQEEFNKFIQPLLPKTEWDVTFDEQGKLKLV